MNTTSDYPSILYRLVHYIPYAHKLVHLILNIEPYEANKHPFLDCEHTVLFS